MFKTTAYAACVHIREIPTKQHKQIQDYTEERDRCRSPRGKSLVTPNTMDI